MPIDSISISNEEEYIFLKSKNFMIPLTIKGKVLTAFKLGKKPFFEMAQSTALEGEKEADRNWYAVNKYLFILTFERLEKYDVNRKTLQKYEVKDIMRRLHLPQVLANEVYERLKADHIKSFTLKEGFKK